MTPVLEEGPAGQETYQALLRLYTIALQQAVDMQEGNFSWVNMQSKRELIHVQQHTRSNFGKSQI